MVVCTGAVDEAFARHRAALGGFGSRRDLVAVQREVGNQRPPACHRKAINGIRRDLVSILRPFDKGISIGCSSGHRRSRAVLVRSCTCDSTACFRIRFCSNSVSLLRKFCLVCSSFSDCKGKGVFGGHLTAVLGPIDEGIALIGYGRQCAVLAVVVSAGALNGATLGRVGRSLDLVAVQREVGNQRPCAFHRETNGRISGENRSVFAPARKGVALVGPRRQFAG